MWNMCEIYQCWTLASISDLQGELQIQNSDCFVMNLYGMLGPQFIKWERVEVISRSISRYLYHCNGNPLDLCRFRPITHVLAFRKNLKFGQTWRLVWIVRLYAFHFCLVIFWNTCARAPKKPDQPSNWPVGEVTLQKLATLSAHSGERILSLSVSYILMPGAIWPCALIFLAVINWIGSRRVFNHCCWLSVCLLSVLAVMTDWFCLVLGLGHVACPAWWLSYHKTEVLLFHAFKGLCWFWFWLVLDYFYTFCGTEFWLPLA